MIRPEVAEYLRTNLPKHSVTELRLQLEEEGVTASDFEDSLADALRGPRPAPPAKRAKPPSTAAKIALVGGLALLIGVSVYALAQRLTPMAPAPSDAEKPAESGFVGAQGWVVRLPKGYEGVSEFKDDDKTVEVVHFCPSGTDPTNFIDKGLFGEMGIVRLEVAPSQFPANMTGAAEMSAAVARKTTARGETYVLKNIQIGTLPGVQIDIQSPFPRVEAYVLGQSSVYFFYGGQDDDVWRAIVLSLRDAKTED
jgi:hypothetical protein